MKLAILGLALCCAGFAAEVDRAALEKAGARAERELGTIRSQLDKGLLDADARKEFEARARELSATLERNKTILAPIYAAEAAEAAHKADGLRNQAERERIAAEVLKKTELEAQEKAAAAPRVPTKIETHWKNLPENLKVAASLVFTADKCNGEHFMDARRYYARAEAAVPGIIEAVGWRAQGLHIISNAGKVNDANRSFEEANKLVPGIAAMLSSDDVDRMRSDAYHREIERLAREAQFNEYRQGYRPPKTRVVTDQP